MISQKRNTRPKQAILDLLQQSRYAMSQEMIEAELNGEVNRVTIYRVLYSFEEDGIVHKVISDDGKAYFAICKGCTHEHHDHDHTHFKCVSCLKVECLKQPVQVKLPQGYKSIAINLLVSGLCRDCR